MVAVAQDLSGTLVKTKYGEMMVSAMPVMGMRTLVLIWAVPMIPAGAVLHRTRRHDPDGTYDVYKHGLCDAVSGLMRAERRATVTEEIPDLMVSRRAVHTALMHLKQYPLLKQRVLPKVAELATAVGQDLENVENHEKLIARTQILRAAHITDRLNRPNPGRNTALLVAGNSHLWKRIVEIGRIYPILNADVLALSSLIEEYEMRFGVVGDVIDDWRKRVLVMRATPTSEEQNEFFFSTAAACQALNDMYGAPYRSIALRLSRTLNLQGTATESLTRQRMKDILESARQSALAPKRLRRLMELNIQSGFLEKARVSGEEFVATAKSLKEQTLNAMWEFAKSVPRENGPIYRTSIEQLKMVFDAGLKNPKRTWLRDTRERVRAAVCLAA